MNKTSIDSLSNSNELKLRERDFSKTCFCTNYLNNTVLAPQTHEPGSENCNNENPTHLSNDAPILNETSRNDSPQAIPLITQKR